MAKQQAPFDKLSDLALIKIDQLVPDLIPVSEPTLYRMINAGSFPKPIKLADKRASAWNVGEVRKWLKTRTA